MKRHHGSTLLFLASLIVLCLSPSDGMTRAGRPGDPGIPHRQIHKKMSALQVPFIANEGQVAGDVRYYAKTFGGTLFVTRHGEMVYSLPEHSSPPGRGPERDGTSPKDQERRGWVLKERLLGALKPVIQGNDRAETRVNYFIGNDRSRWKCDIPSYNEVSFGEVYEGISLKLRAYGNNVEKVFKVRPGFRPETIKFAVKGALFLTIGEKGRLEVETGLGTVAFSTPVAYQEKEGKREYVQIAYSLGHEGYGFSVDNYDKTLPLVIDPMLASTFLGGSGTDWSHSLALDGSGNVYVKGSTTSADFPFTAGAYDGGHNGAEDIFISKLNPDLTLLLVSTYIGGSGQERPGGLAIDGAGNVYIAGTTLSGNYPTTAGAYDTTYAGGWDSYISKLNSGLNTLLASTFIGGSGNDDEVYALVLDVSNSRLYVTGKNFLGGYPTTAGAYDTAFNGSNDIIVSRLDLNLTTLQASTYIGGSSQDIGAGIALDSAGNVIIFGKSESSNYPTTTGAYDQTHNGNWDLVVSKLNADLTTLQASTYIGGSATDAQLTGGSLVLDSSNNVCVAGCPSSSNYPTTAGAYDQTHNGGEDAVISILSPDLSSLQASTFLGGSGQDRATTPIIDSTGNVYVFGYTTSTGFPTTPGAYDTVFGGSYDIFISRLSSDLTTLQASTFVGGSGADDAYHGDLLLDGSGHVYITAGTGSADFPTTAGAYDTTHNGGGYDVFVSKLTGDLLAGPNGPPVAPTAVSPADEAVIATVSGVSGLSLVASDFSDPEGDAHLCTHWLVRRADRVYNAQGPAYDPTFSHVATSPL
ncbi:MAG: SBBP repeat-containing protein, partial [Deltaproteobacteria bacterium]|nr:SBBP repeat-containing protein [Deltaproteobacteria bacterium]